MVKQQSPSFSQLRQDPVSGDWIVIAVQRAKRPDDFKKKPAKDKEIQTKPCVFCQIVSKETPILVQANGEEIASSPFDGWTIAVVNNKYPAFIPDLGVNRQKIGPYQTMNGFGYHELVVAKDHHRRFGQMEPVEIKEILSVYKKRYLVLSRQTNINYVAIFHNEGQSAGASVEHPHSQIIAIPTTDTDIQSSLDGSKKFWQRNNYQCPHCAMIKYDQKSQERVVWENDQFLVCCSFAPKSAFEIKIYPKKHQAYFEEINDNCLFSLAQAFKIALKSIERGLGDPDYNFFLHTAPCDGKNYEYYHWHWQIQPKTQTLGGFELGVKIEISTITPEDSAQYLKKQIKDVKI
ncbi:MAG: DUF4921 family protein [Candidatus Shapirobacteria bacterium]|nr:DUF4921 family protein [Candidatus Shapirobacteria bacterium]